MRSSPRTALGVIAAVAVMALWGGPAAAQPSPFEPGSPSPAGPRSPSPSVSPSGEVSEQDRDYLMEAHQANLAEIAAGKLAQEKGSSQVVKDLGAKMVEDHTKLDDELKPVAEQLGVELPSEPAAQHKATAAVLAAVPSGQQWDQLWIGSQIAAHEASKENAQDQVKLGSESSVKDLAGKAQPVIQGHLDELMKVAPQFGIEIQR